MLTNGRIEQAVQAALRSDPRVHAPGLIAVSADQIGTVVLSGAVASLPERLAAIHDAKEVDGVFEVIADRLRVHPPIGQRRTDDELTAAAMQRVSDDVRVRSSHIHVKASRGWLTLSGYVRHESERAAAVQDAADVAGARGVVDKLEVR
ncbi:MAG TPA: BON domain-containing protein [Solirubrobacteraceae bacterium]|nr:BON domain-containing protein [Solirubrobacteraceae bacterium]